MRLFQSYTGIAALSSLTRAFESSCSLCGAGRLSISVAALRCTIYTTRSCSTSQCGNGRRNVQTLWHTNCLRTLCGTTQYVAPDVLDLHSPGYDQRADRGCRLVHCARWVCSVHELANFICRGEYEFHYKYWGDISDAAKQ
jgi:hypothetical protein